MTEISTDYELLVVQAEPAVPGARARRSFEAAENDGGVLHRYGPHVEIRRTQPIGIGGAPVAAAPTRRAAPGTLSFAESRHQSVHAAPLTRLSHGQGQPPARRRVMGHARLRANGRRYARR